MERAEPWPSGTHSVQELATFVQGEASAWTTPAAVRPTRASTERAPATRRESVCIAIHSRFFELMDETAVSMPGRRDHVLVDGAAFHHERDLPQARGVGQGIARHGDDVGVVAGRNAADPAAEAQRFSVH